MYFSTPSWAVCPQEQRSILEVGLRARWRSATSQLMNRLTICCWCLCPRNIVWTCSSVITPSQFQRGFEKKFEISPIWFLFGWFKHIPNACAAVLKFNRKILHRLGSQVYLKKQAKMSKSRSTLQEIDTLTKNQTKPRKMEISEHRSYIPIVTMISLLRLALLLLPSDGWFPVTALCTRRLNWPLCKSRFSMLGIISKTIIIIKQKKKLTKTIVEIQCGAL